MLPLVRSPLGVLCIRMPTPGQARIERTVLSSGKKNQKAEKHHIQAIIYGEHTHTVGCTGVTHKSPVENYEIGG